MIMTFDKDTCGTCALANNAVTPCSRCTISPFRFSPFKISDAGRTNLWQPTGWFIEIEKLQELERIVRDFHFAYIDHGEFVKRSAAWIMARDDD
jgi:hypothetical protein